MTVTGDWLTHPGTQSVLGVLQDAGHTALAVGGCVRNALLGAPVGDVDIATDARPDRVTELAQAAGLRVVPTGIDHGTVTVFAHGTGYEVTTFRADVETDGRHAVVRFSDDVAEDAARRDFTMNALYARADGTLVDPLGGLPDLHARRVRFVGNAVQRIREDYLRILRYFRFSAWYGDPAQGFDADALDAVARNLDGLDRLSRERVGAEVVKLFSAPDPAPAVAAMAQTGVLARVLPGADAVFLAPLVHLEQGLDLPPDPLRRLAALGVTDGDALRLSRAQARHLALLADQVAGTAGPGELGYRLGAVTARDVLVLRAALFGTVPDPGALSEAQIGAAAVFPVVAQDLMPGLTGKALGDRLADLEARWIASGFALGKAALLRANRKT